MKGRNERSVVSVNSTYGVLAEPHGDTRGTTTTAVKAAAICWPKKVA